MVIFFVKRHNQKELQTCHKSDSKRGKRNEILEEYMITLLPTAIYLGQSDKKNILIKEEHAITREWLSPLIQKQKG